MSDAIDIERIKELIEDNLETLEGGPELAEQLSVLYETLRRCCMNQLARCTCPNPARLSDSHVALRHTQRRHPIQNPTLDSSFNLLILQRARP